MKSTTKEIRNKDKKEFDNVDYEKYLEDLDLFRQTTGESEEEYLKRELSLDRLRVEKSKH